MIKTLEKENVNKTHIGVFHLGIVGILNLIKHIKTPTKSNRFSPNKCSPQRREITH